MFTELYDLVDGYNQQVVKQDNCLHPQIADSISDFSNMFFTDEENSQMAPLNICGEIEVTADEAFEFNQQVIERVNFELTNENSTFNASESIAPVVNLVNRLA